MSSRAAPVIAIGAASVAVVLSLAALVVSVRSPSVPEIGAVPFETAMASADVAKLRSDVVDVAKDDDRVIGVRIIDDTVYSALGLTASDVITAIAGRPIKRISDVADAMRAASSLDPTMLYVDVLRDGEPVLLRWKLDANLRAGRSGLPNDPPSRLSGDTDTFAAIDAIRKIDDLTYEVPRSTVDAIAGDPAAFAKGARIIPGISMGNLKGFKVYAIRPNSVFSKLGLSNGDLIREINGFELSSAAQALEAFAKLKHATSLEIALTRGGRDETIRITIH